MNNLVFVTGNIGLEPEVIGDWNKVKAVGFSIAIPKSKRNETTGEYEVIHTNWFKVVAFGDTAAQIRASIHQGALVTIEGSLQSSKYINKDGIEVSSIEIIAKKITKKTLIKKPEVKGLPLTNEKRSPFIQAK